MSNELVDVALVVQQTMAPGEPCQHYNTEIVDLRVQSRLSYAKALQQIAQRIEEPNCIAFGAMGVSGTARSLCACLKDLCREINSELAK